MAIRSVAVRPGCQSTMWVVLTTLVFPPERSQAELNALVRQIHERGFQAAIHSNGDLEIDMVLTAIEALPDDAATARHRIEHASVMTERLLTRAKIANVVLALHSYVYEHGDKMEDYGAHRWDWMHVNRRALDMGVVVAGNSDYPISGANPFLRFQKSGYTSIKGR